MKINGYELLTPLSYNKSGLSKWGFAEKDGEEYFIKEFLSPLYPTKRDLLTDKEIEEKITACKKFQEGKSRLFRAISECMSGNIVPVYQFFRHSSNYYIVTDKIDANTLSPQDMKKMSPYQKLMITRILAYSLGLLHSKGIVHFDIKPDNVLFSKSQSGIYTAKLIDFDSSFFMDNPPENSENFKGDPVYLAPESYLYMAGKGKDITTKADVFSLGVMLHVFWSGELVRFNREKYEYAYESVLNGEELDFSSEIPRGIAVVLNQMLKCNPNDRPSLSSVFMALAKINFDK